MFTVYTIYYEDCIAPDIIAKPNNINIVQHGMSFSTSGAKELSEASMDSFNC